MRVGVIGILVKVTDEVKVSLILRATTIDLEKSGG
jgi:hypothetical protein